MKSLALAPALLLAACATVPPSPSCPVPEPRIIEVPVKIYVPIDAALRKRCPWKRGVPPSQSMAAARERADCLEDYERKFDAIGKVQGKPVPAGP